MNSQFFLVRLFQFSATFLIALCSSANAQSFYQKVPRFDDQFVYCTQGAKDTKAWKPAKPYASAAYRPSIGYCPYPTTSCCDSYCALRPWSQEDYNDYFQNRVVVCPQAKQDGRWDRSNGLGNPEDEPISH